MYKPEEIKAMIDKALDAKAYTNAPGAQAYALIAQAQALIELTAQVARLVELVEMTIDQQAGAVVTRPADEGDY